MRSDENRRRAQAGPVQSRINKQTPRREPPATLPRVIQAGRALHFSPAKRHDFSPPFTNPTVAPVRCHFSLRDPEDCLPSNVLMIVAGYRPLVGFCVKIYADNELQSSRLTSSSSQIGETRSLVVVPQSIPRCSGIEGPGSLQGFLVIFRIACLSGVILYSVGAADHQGRTFSAW